MATNTNARLTREQAFEQGRALGMDHAEAHAHADSLLEAQGRRMAEARMPESLTVKVYGDSYELSGQMLVHIQGEREKAASFRRVRNAPAESATRTELRKTIEREFGVTADRATQILAAVRQAPVKGWKPEHLDLAVRWANGWKLYEVTGTRHAYYLLRKLAQREGFLGARLNDPLLRSDGYVVDNVIALSVDDVTGSDAAGKYRALLDRRNSHYDLQRDDRQS